QPLVVVGAADPAHRVLHPGPAGGFAQLGVQTRHGAYRRLWGVEDADGQRRVPAAAAMVASSPVGRAREARSGCSGELYQSITSLHSSRTQDGPYSHWVPPSSRETGSPSIASTSAAGMPWRREMAVRDVVCRLLTATPAPWNPGSTASVRDTHHATRSASNTMPHPAPRDGLRAPGSGKGASSQRGGSTAAGLGRACDTGAAPGRRP